MQALANVNMHHSENGAHRVFREFGQALPVKISRIDLPSKKRFPFVKCSDWMKYLAETDRLNLVVGSQKLSEVQPLLREFWDRYRSVAPTHEIYQREQQGLLDCSRTLPLLHHGDEGRGYKKLQVMISSTHGLLGNGCRMTDPGKLNPTVVGGVDDPMKLNMVGNAFLTHFIHFLMPVAVYKETPQAFDMLMEALAKDYASLFYDGFKVESEQFWACCVACKGDSPFLVKAGHFDRSFYHRPLKAQSRTAGVGVCHACCAGKEDWVPRVECEEFGSNPTWLQTVEVLCPWTIRPPFLDIPRELDNPNGERFFQMDLFHNFHLGAGKYFISSAVVSIIDSLLVGSSWGERFEKLTDEFSAFCKQRKFHAYYKKLTAEMFGVATNQQNCPKGNWPKGDQTTMLAMFLEDFCDRHVVGRVHDPTLVKIAP